MYAPTLDGLREKEKEINSAENAGASYNDGGITVIELLERRGVPVGDHRARQVTMEDYRHFDRVYYMDRSNRNYLARLLPSDPEKIRPLLSHDVADPWYTGDFEKTYTDLLEGCRAIMEEFT